MTGDAVATTWQTKPRGGRLGNGFFIVLIRCGGLALAPFFLFWVALYFLVAAPAARRASFNLARHLGRGRFLPGRLWFAFRHFYTFGLLLLDRIAILAADQAHKYHIDFIGEENIRNSLGEGKGVVLLTLHYFHCFRWEIRAAWGGQSGVARLRERG